MATASVPENKPAARSGEKKPRRRSTRRIKQVPADRPVRDEIQERCRQVAAELDKSRPLSPAQMESLARSILEHLGQPDSYLGFTMVVLASAFWSDQVAAVPPSRRLLLLPHCLKDAAECPAEYDEFRLRCEPCGKCSIGDFSIEAEKMGYRVLVAEGSPVVMKIIVSGEVDAIAGVACLNVLEKALDKILLAGIPCMAVPLLSSNCKNTSVDRDWVEQMVRLRRQASPTQRTRTFVHLMRAAANLVQNDQLQRLAPRQRTGSSDNGNGAPHEGPIDPIAVTEHLAYDFLASGGKLSRPFITLAMYDALTGADCTLPDGARHLDAVPDAVRCAALAIEAFHKASLVHDDVEDDDAFRYGEPTLHRRHGVPTAVNVGDYLIGLGYRLISRQAEALGADVVTDIVAALSDAHARLTEGQGAELWWRDAGRQQLQPLEALKIYALKTAPAFEAALFAGARMAGPVDGLLPLLRPFARNVGVAFQILNDLNDWTRDEHNKLAAGADVFGKRPTVLWALALAGLPESGRRRLQALLGNDAADAPARLNQVRQLYADAGAFEQAHQLVDKYQDRAEELVDGVEQVELQQLLFYLVDAVLERPTEVGPEVHWPSLLADQPSQ